MQLVAVRPTIAPGCCFICEQSNDSAYVLTDYAFDAHVPTHLNGKKFVCASCIEAMAKLLGMVTFNEHADLRRDYRDAEEELAVNDSYRILADAVVEAGKALRAAKSKPTAAVKAVKEPAS